VSERWTPIYDRMFDPDHELAKGDPACQRWAFMDLCHMAQWKDGARVVGGTVIKLPRGCFLASVRYLAERWKWSKNRADRFLAALQHPEVGKIRHESVNRYGTVYRIVNYDVYANPRDTHGDANEDANGTQTGQRTTSTVGNNVVARAVGDFCERLGCSWKLNRGIEEWVDDLRREPRYAGVNLEAEIRECAEWHEGKGRKPRAPDRSIRNWLKVAAKDANPNLANGKHWADSL